MSDAAGRPRDTVPLLVRIAVVVGLGLVFCEGSLRLLADASFGEGPIWGGFFSAVAPILQVYEPVRGFAMRHPAVAIPVAVAAFGIILIAFRALLIFWHNVVKARISGTYFEPDDPRFPSGKFDLLDQIARRPKEHLFVGMEPVKRIWGWRWRPVYLTQRQKTMHRHVLGKTGSGKTQSILWPAVFQDMLDGKGILVMDAKGSDENIVTMKNLAILARRLSQLRVFSLPAWNQPQVFTHTYNLVYVRPRAPGDRGGDPVATAQRVFSVLPLGDNEYYNVQAQIMFTNVCKLLHATVDEQGYGRRFTVKDVAVLFKCIGAKTQDYRTYLEGALERSSDVEARAEIRSQIDRLGPDARKCFSGIIGALDQFLSPIVNACDPDIVFEEVLEKNLIVYVQLPANLFKIQAPAMGRAILMDVQQEGSLRQVQRSTRNQTPFSVTVDEFYNFADLSIVDSLNKLRDANLEYTLAHQSIADLELVSPEFAVAVWDNTRTKDILSQDNPELCEKVSRSVGTRQVVEKTVRHQQGALFTSLATGDASTKLVEAYKLHPNAIKGLERCGQGYLYNDEGLRPVSYAMLPPFRWNGALEKKVPDESRALNLVLPSVPIDERGREDDKPKGWAQASPVGASEPETPPEENQESL